MPFCLGEKRIHSAFTVASKFAGFTSSSAEEIHSVGTINNVKTFLLYTTEVCYLMTTFRCLSDILITSWLFTARWSTWPGNHLVPCVAELVGACIPIRINAHQCLPDPKCLFYPSGLSLCLSVDHFCLVPVDDMVLFPCHRLGQGKSGWHRDAGSYQLSHTWEQVISKSRAPSSCKQSRRDQDVRWAETLSLGNTFLVV